MRWRLWVAITGTRPNSRGADVDPATVKNRTEGLQLTDTKRRPSTPRQKATSDQRHLAHR
jgi:hypothetical protein